MTPQSQAILSRAEYDSGLSWGEEELLTHDEHRVVYLVAEENARLLPIIRELLEIVEMQRKALEKYASNKQTLVLDGDGNTTMLDRSLTPAGQALTATDERLKRLGSS